jgi:secondary thiamine-phosphate synthase enzyme
MKVLNKKITLKTRGNPDLINITDAVADAVSASKLKSGSATVFIVGSTAGVTTFEYEPGLEKDMRELYEKLVPSDRHYSHDETWGDANGFSHLRAALTGPSLVVPFENGRLALGTWQQIVLAEFDNRPRRREIIIQLTGE